MAWTTAWAPTAAELAVCVRCGLCLPHCPTYRLTGDEAASPRGRLVAMAAVGSGRAVIDATFTEMMEFCLQCRGCEEACPALVPFGRAMAGARAEVAAGGSRWRRLRARMVSRAPGRRLPMRAATLSAALLQRLGGRNWLPGRLGRGISGLRHLPVAGRSLIGRTFSAYGSEVGTAALLAGCVMDRWFAGVHVATVELLRRAGYRVVVPEGQGCCGALAAHQGDAAEAQALAKRNVAAFDGFDLVVADAGGCSAHMKEYGAWAGLEGAALASGVKDVTEVVADAIEAELLPRLRISGDRVAVQDPCHLRHGQRVVKAPRLILEAAGLEVVEIDPDGLCCGAAGVYVMLRPADSRALGERLAERIRAARVRVVASANPGCEIQVRSHLGDGYRVAHPVELYAERLR